MSDLFGAQAQASVFKDIRNQRESVAEEKATLCKELNLLLRRTPPPAAIASVQAVRGFKVSHASALKTLQSKTSSRADLRSAIGSIKAWLE